MNWRLQKLLEARRGGSLITSPLPDKKLCSVLKPFSHEGRQLRCFDRFKSVDADSLELDSDQARALQAKGLISVMCPADKLRCTYPGATRDWLGYQPWNMSGFNPPALDWRGDDLSSFDDSLVRVCSIGIAGTQIVPGLILASGHEPVYLPFRCIRSMSSGYHIEIDRQPRGLVKVFLDEFAPLSADQPQKEVAI